MRLIRFIQQIREAKTPKTGLVPDAYVVHLDVVRNPDEKALKKMAEASFGEVRGWLLGPNLFAWPAIQGMHANYLKQHPEVARGGIPIYFEPDGSVRVTASLDMTDRVKKGTASQKAIAQAIEEVKRHPIWTRLPRPTTIWFG